MRPAHDPLLSAVQARLDQVIRYDDESIVHDKWIRQRYDCGCFPSLIPARRATVSIANPAQPASPNRSSAACAIRRSSSGSRGRPVVT